MLLVESRDRLGGYMAERARDVQRSGDLKRYAAMMDEAARLEQLRSLGYIGGDLDPDRLPGAPVVVADHCYGCTAGQGSSCGGALRGDAPG